MAHGKMEVMRDRVNRLRLHAPILCNMEHAQFVDVSEVDNGGVQ